MNKVSHFELPADDIARARKFYSDVFGWASNEVPEMDYTMVQTGPTDEQGLTQEPGFVNGGMLQREEGLTAPIITIEVPDIDAAAEQVEANGGQVIISRQRVGDMGYSSYFKDTEGNTIGLWQNVA